jgi:hypothetical protein
MERSRKYDERAQKISFDLVKTEEKIVEIVFLILFSVNLIMQMTRRGSIALKSISLISRTRPEKSGEM